MKRLGIDFGTSYIKCSDASKEQLIPLDKKRGGESLNKIANIITYYNDGQIKLGAPLQRLRKPDEVLDEVIISNIKTKLSDKNWVQTLNNDKEINAVKVTDDVFKCIYDLLHLKNKNESDLRATITTPVCFSERQREIVRRAAEKAGFKVESVITEPFASLFYLMRDNLDENHNVLIIDIGGGTLDICLVRITVEDDVCEIKTESTVGLNFGGITINNKIIDEILIKKYHDKLAPLLIDTENPNEADYNRYHLFNDVDNIKEEIFQEDYDEEDSDEPYDIIYGTWKETFEMSLSANDIFRMLNDNKISDILINLLDNVIDDSSLLCEDITDVFLTGGSSMIPYFKNVVTEYFRDNGTDDTDELFELFEDLDFEEQAVGAVALGAGIYNVITSEENENYSIKDKIPFTIFTKDSSGKMITKLMADCSYKSYRSLEGIIDANHLKENRIDVYQKMPDENGTEIYIGYIELDNSIVENCKYFKLGINSDRKVFAEFGNIEGNKNNAEFVTAGEKKYLRIDI